MVGILRESFKRRTRSFYLKSIAAAVGETGDKELILLTELKSVTLKDGKEATIARVKGPDARWAGKILPLLNHKGGIWAWQNEKVLLSPTKPLESYYYVAIAGNEPVCNVSTFEYAGIGILGHVYTKPEFRRKGCCSATMAGQMDDFQAREGKALMLGTGFDSPAWNIYYGFGFLPLYEKSGYMAYYTNGESAFESEYYKPGKSYVRPVDWRDWAGLSALTCQKTGSNLRLVSLEIYNRTSMEHSFLNLYRRILEKKDAFAVALESESTGAVAGIAYTFPDFRFPGVRIIDLYVHPNFSAMSGALLASLDNTGEVSEKGGKVQAYAEATDSAKIAALEAAGFGVEATLARQMKLDNGVVDIVLLSRG